MSKDALLDDNPKLTEILFSIQTQLEGHARILANMDARDEKEAEANERRAREAGVTDPDPKPDTKPEPTNKPGNNEEGGGNNFFGLFGALGGFLASATAGVTGSAGLFKTIGKGVIKWGLVGVITPLIGEFIQGAVDKALTMVGVEDDLAEGIANDISFAGMAGIVAFMINRTLALPAFLGALGLKLGKRLDEADGVADDVSFGINADLLAGVTSVLGVGMGFYIQKKLMSLAKAAADKLKNAGLKTTTTSTGPGTTSVRPDGAIQDDKKPGGNNSSNKATILKQNTDKLNLRVAELRNTGVRQGAINNLMPGGMTIGDDGIARRPSGQFASNAEVQKALAALDGITRTPWLMNTLKFAGIAASVGIPMIDVYNAIKRGATQEEVLKELSGALGAVGGAALGMKAGAIAGFFGGGPIGAGIVSILGSGIGAISGAMLAEAIAEQVIYGKSATLDLLQDSMMSTGYGMATGFNPTANPFMLMEMEKQQNIRIAEQLKSGEKKPEDIISNRSFTDEKKNEILRKFEEFQKEKNDPVNIVESNLPMIFPNTDGQIETGLNMDNISDINNILFSPVPGSNGKTDILNQQNSPIMFSPVNQSETIQHSFFLNSGGNSLDNTDQSQPVKQ